MNTINTGLAAALDRLSPTQRMAAEWDEGAALVLAGPGVGKTTVLTARLARILEQSRGKHFRVLALTFTTKAGDEMRERVEELVPGLTERTVIGTFHSFCAQLLRQHGSHLQIKPDFGVYDQDDDRKEVLRDALREAEARGEPVSSDDIRWLKVIDQLRSELVSAEKSAVRFGDSEVGARVARVYAIYEAALRAHNRMDFNGMILDACRLAHRVPAVAARIRQSYPYWMIDEFQDTSPAQYRLVRFLAGDAFRNIFVVADDDQIIYQWAGASYRQIVRFRSHFQPELFQLVENRRCPPAVVAAANHLIKHNSERTPDKASLVATRPEQEKAISLRVYADDRAEGIGIATEIAAAGIESWDETAVLGRTRAVLSPTLEALRQAGVRAAIATRRDRFISPQFSWLQACLDQSLRPMDRRSFVAMVNAANHVAGLDSDAVLDTALLIAEAEASGRGFLEHWALAVKGTGNAVASRLGELALNLVRSRGSWRSVVKEALVFLLGTAAFENGVVSDAADDKAAWEAATRALRAEKGGDDFELAEFLQGLALRPKEPPPEPNTVNLMTVHAAKGLEFDHVWVLGLAQGVLPSWQSLQSEAKPAVLEEERRNCFVAITRTRRTLVLSHASRYNGYSKSPSRFLGEMGIEQDTMTEL